MNNKAKYYDIVSNIKTGDVLLFSGHGWDSKIIGFFTRTKWTHVGVAIKVPDWDLVLLWEFSPITYLSDVFHGKRRRGIQLVPLEHRLKTYKGQVAIRHLREVDIEEEPILKKTFANFMKETSNRYIEVGIFGGIKFRFQFCIDAIRSLFLDKDVYREGINCSAITAELFQKLGLLERPPKGKLSRRYIPKDYENMVLRKGYLSDLIEIEF